MESVNDLLELPFPLICSPKVDGIRCVTLDRADGSGHQCLPVSRNHLRIRNDHVYEQIASLCPPGLDGELVYGSGSLTAHKFNVTSSMLTRSYGEPAFTYCIFDYCPSWQDSRWIKKGIVTKYETRLKMLNDLDFRGLPDFCTVLSHRVCGNVEAVQEYHDECVSGGYEGICIRTRHSPYKFGRSTLREGWLIKMKTFVDSEAEIIGFTERMHNSNPHMDHYETTKRRHTNQAGMVPTGMMGSLKVRDLQTGVEFELGTGFDEMTRVQIWIRQEDYLGRIVKYKHQPHGQHEKPRMPVFLGFRDQE
jgi:ATP dependent DNA ligase domain.